MTLGESMKTTLSAIAIVLLFAGAARAETCMKSGEEAGGMGKTCYYQCTFGQTATNIGAAQLCPLTHEAGLPNASRRSDSDGRAHVGGGGGACFKQGERTTGMTKQCFYDCTGTSKTVTIGSTELCPLTAH